MRKNLKAYILFIGITVLFGILGGLIAGGTEIYEFIEKPPLAPPPILFPIVWTILYVLIGIAAARVYLSKDLDSSSALKFYWLQLAVNILWPLIFFGFKLYAFAAIWLLILIVLIIITTVKFFRIDKVAGILMLPYLAWCLFALYLNFSIAVLN